MSSPIVVIRGNSVLTLTRMNDGRVGDFYLFPTPTDNHNLLILARFENERDEPVFRWVSPTSLPREVELPHYDLVREAFELFREEEIRLEAQWLEFDHSNDGPAFIPNGRMVNGYHLRRLPNRF